MSSALEEIQERENKSGVIYLSSIPPYMKPQHLRNVLSQYGQVGRIYMTPEDAAATQSRKKMSQGKLKRKKYVDGWVEFPDKSLAKSVAAALNGRTFGGKKRHNFWRDFTWTMRYLPKFKWHHLNEFKMQKKRARTDRLRAEMTQTMRENLFYASQVDQVKKDQKAREKIAEKKRKREAAAEEREGMEVKEESEGGSRPPEAGIKRARHQPPVKKEGPGEAQEAPSQSERVRKGDDRFVLKQMKKEKGKRDTGFLQEKKGGSSFSSSSRLPEGAGTQARVKEEKGQGRSMSSSIIKRLVL